MAQNQSPVDIPRRPKGILKNSSSYLNQLSPSQVEEFQYSPPARSSSITYENHPSGFEGPGIAREVSEKDITHQNTIANAGPRRNSSNARSSRTASRRQSSAMDVDMDDNNPRLKWDEANLYLTEQERGNTMKIDEPKTPYVKQYDPMEDAEEMAALDAQDLNVDELDTMRRRSGRAPRGESIPSLDLGEPEEPVMERVMSDGEKRVIVEDGYGDTNGNGEEFHENMTDEEKRKHREFEERRKRHYEMGNIKDLLGHNEEMEDADDA